MAAQIKLLSAGAVKPALVKAIEQFRNVTGAQVRVNFATGPEIRQLLEARDVADVVIAPTELIDLLAHAGKIATANRVTLGRIGVGVMVRDSRPLPQIATVETFQLALLNAESLVYNQASTGIYLESLFNRFGVATELKSKTIRYPDFAAVLKHIANGNDNELGFGATTVIVENAGKGVTFVGPLPAEIQNYTTYAVAIIADSPARDTATELVKHLTGPMAQAIFTGAGIE